MGKTTKALPEELRTPLRVTREDRDRAYARLLGLHLSNMHDSPEASEALAVLRDYEVSISEKIDALALHYGLPSPISADSVEVIEAYRGLLVAVASEVAPAFGKKGTCGRPAEKWDDKMRRLLVLDMERRFAQSGTTRGISFAASQLAKKWYWAAFVSKKEDVLESSTEAALRAAYYAARDKISDAQKVFDDLWREKPIEEWDQYVMEQVIEKLCKLRFEDNWQQYYFNILNRVM
ncbi:hypothetical protein [Paraburkholderia caffeinilytica]|uniref:hypothetical protein n=1 Tax=Paraburkholderia caffeinilytica TaxID=1761016 RepID=UPI003DA0BC1A